MNKNKNNKNKNKNKKNKQTSTKTFKFGTTNMHPEGHTKLQSEGLVPFNPSYTYIAPATARPRHCGGSRPAWQPYQDIGSTKHLELSQDEPANNSIYKL